MIGQDYTDRFAAFIRSGTIFNSFMRGKNREISLAKTHTLFRILIRDLFFVSLIFFSCIFLLWGCGNDVQDVSPAAYSDTGSASLNIRWQDTQYFQNSTASQSSLNCGANGIEYVVCNVYDTSTGTLLITGGPWDCEAHGGTIKGIPVGQDRTFVLLAEDSSGNVQWRGEVTGVAIVTGHNNENVKVDAYRFVPSLIFPNNGEIIDPEAYVLEWEPCVDALEYIVQVAKDEDFNDIVIDQTTPGPTYEPTVLLPSTEYYWKISGIDLYDNIGAESETISFITADCTYSISSNNNTFNSDGGTGMFDVSPSSSSCEWYAETDATWLTITSESSGIGDGTVTYTVLPNNGVSRTAVITIDDQTHMVKQDPALGSLKVTIVPPEAVSEGARWRVDGGDWNSSGYTQNGLSVGNHVLEFNTIPGWNKPANQTVTIYKNQTTNTNGEYSPLTVFELNVNAFRIINYYASLTWSGANSTFVDVYRNGSRIATTLNDGAYTHGPFSDGTPATYQLCESGTSICSNMVPVSW